MRAIAVHHSEKNYQLVFEHASIPVLGAHDVLICVAACGVNRADLFQAEGGYAAPEGASQILGLEVSGTIEAMGAEVKSFSPNEAVMALLTGGGYAEYIVVSEWRVLSKPENLSFEQAAGVMECFATVYQTVFEKAALGAGEWLLVHGGASGIGTAAIQLAKKFGAKVAVTAGTDEKCARCLALGADVAVNYKTQDFVEILPPKSINVVLDMVGGDYMQRNLKVLGKKGRLVQVAFLQGARAELNMASLLLKNITWIGSTLRFEEEEAIYHLLQSMRTTVLPLLQSGELVAVIDRVFSLDEAQAAHDYLRAGEHVGKVILAV